jgi:NADH-quinone oxidoreductase subunit F
MTPEQNMCDEVEKRGEAARSRRRRVPHGHQVGDRSGLKEQADQKYIDLSTADEGDPGAYMDRVAHRGRPVHRLLEGLAIARLRHRQPRRPTSTSAPSTPSPSPEPRKSRFAGREAAGLLGKEHPRLRLRLSTIRIHRGAGAFVCGEETALLLNSIEGKRGDADGPARRTRR